MKSFKLINGWLLLFLFIQTAQLSFAQETEADLKVKADKLFHSEQFVEATPLYLHLIALNPRSTDYNYKYGTCLLFNSNKKQDAFKYLNFSITDPAIAPEAYFYLGKAYHLNFQFNEAIKNYNVYIQKSAGKPNPGFEVERQIEMCQNGKKLLTTITDLVVLEKKQIEYGSFFRLYNLSHIGGVILITADYQSKIDKKRNHTPLIHFPDNAQTVYYSSYGESDKGSKDIYCRKRLPDGKWGLPALVPGNVNTKFDEDFPYLSPNGEYLYFCSKGHNSMGGFDVFRSRFDAETNSFGDPENMDFAISSPDNDLFYVVDSLEQNAYFASARQSENGKIHVYKVRVDRVPLQLAIVKGEFKSSINPENKKLSIKVTDVVSGNEVGVFNSNEEGKYLITFPKGGKYTYEMTVGGSTTIHKSQVNIPFLKEFKPLKQKIQEEALNNEEVVRVVDLFNEEVEDAQGILAEVIRARAELNVNAGHFDINALDAQKENKKVLADIGLENASNQEIISKFEAIQQKQEQKVDGLERLENGSLIAIVDKAAEVEKLQAEIKKDVAKANAAETKTEKNDILLAANDKVERILELKEEILRIDAFSDSISKLIPKEKEQLKAITELKEAVRKAVVDEKYDQLKEAVIAKADLVKEIENEKETHPVDNLLAQNEAVGKQTEQLKKQLNSYKENDQKLEQELKTLKSELAVAKAKDQPAIQSKIDSREAEKTLVSEETNRLEGKVAELNKKEISNTKQITFINNLQNTDENRKVTKAEADLKVEAIHSNNVKSLESYVKQQVKSIDTSHVTARTNDILAQESKERVEEYEKNYELAQQAVDQQADLTHEEKVALKVKNNEQLDKKLTQELAKVEEGLAKNPNDAKLLTQKEQVLNLKAENTKNKETILSDAVLPKNTSTTAEKELQVLMPDYEEQLKNAATNSNPEEKLKAQNLVDEKLLDQIDSEIDKVYEVLTKDPLNQKMQDKKDALTALKKQKEASVKERQDQLDELQSKQNDELAAITIEKELNQLAPNYEEEKKAIGDGNGIGELKALNQLEEKAVRSIDQELQTLTPKTDALSTRRKEVLQDLKQQFEENIASRNEEIKALNAVVETNPKNTEEKDLAKEVRPTYQETISKIESGTSNPEEKTKLLLEEETKMLVSIREQQEKTKKVLAKTPADSAAIKKSADLDQLQAIHEAKLDEQKQTAVSQAKAKLKDEQLRQEILPTYQVLSTDEIQNLSKEEAQTKLVEEKKLQTALEKQIQANANSLEKTFSAEKTAENQVLTDLLQQSKETEEELKASANKEPVSAVNNDVASLETVLGSDYEFAMSKKAASKEEAEKQLKLLNELSESIELKLDEEKRSETKNDTKIQLLEKQLAEIKQRKGIIEIDLNELIAVKTTDSKNPEKELTKLKEEEQALKTQLAAASNKEKTEIEKKLAVNQEAQKQTNQVIQQKELVSLNQAAEEKKQALEQIPGNDPVKEVVLSRTSETTNAADPLLEKTSDLTLLDAAKQYLDGQKAFEETKQVVQPENALKEQRRRFTIEIGEIEAVLQKTTLDPKQVSELKNQKKILEEAIAKIDQHLDVLAKEKTHDLINDPALSKTVSVQDEQRIASDKTYPKLREQQQEINRLKEAVNQTKVKLEEQRNTYVKTENPAEKAAVQNEIERLSKELNTKNQEIVSKEEALDFALNQVEGNKEAWKNVLTREVQPKESLSTTISEVLAPQVGNGFEIKKETAVQPNVIKKAIPVGVKAPTGLVYRVQVGAFAKPIPEDLFKEFTPVTGEKLDNGITRYLAGYFGNRQRVLDAQQDIRALGYKDAFVVAYCDGKRISLAEARQLEDQGLCKPMRQDSIVMEVIQNTIAQLPQDTIAKYKTEPKVSDYNKAPGAVSAIAIEEIKGLFYTVQVGVYNRPATKEQLHDIDPLVTRRLENGQIRYSTGTFRSVDEARPKKADVIEKGVSDAFITAYYNGERISLQEAKRLLETEGEAILFKEQELPKVQEIPVNEQVAKEYAKANPPVEKKALKEYVLVSRETYPEYPRKLMNQLRIQGDFYFDQTDLRIKTVKAEVLPKLVNQAVIFDTLVKTPVSKEELNEPNQNLVVGVWDKKEIPGSLANWILRLTLPYEVKTTASSIEVSMTVDGEEERKSLEMQFRAQGGRIKAE
ncbi:WD40-like Beta Propeller Repeat protein [compost metagenome]